MPKFVFSIDTFFTSALGSRQLLVVAVQVFSTESSSYFLLIFMWFLPAYKTSSDHIMPFLCWYNIYSQWRRYFFPSIFFSGNFKVFNTTNINNWVTSNTLHWFFLSTACSKTALYLFKRSPPILFNNYSTQNLERI